MALANIDPENIKDALGQWLTRKLATTVAIDNLDISGASGMSNTTVLFTASWLDGGTTRDHELAVRIAPAGPAIFMETDLSREATLMTGLGTAGLPVPVVRWVEEDPAALGAPFLIMDRVLGRVPADDPPFTAAGWVLDLTDDGPVCAPPPSRHWLRSTTRTGRAWDSDSWRRRPAGTFWTRSSTSGASSTTGLAATR